MIDFAIGIDGTGPAADKEYKEEMKHSHVQKALRKFPLSKYFRGPDCLDSATSKDCTKFSMLLAEAAITGALQARKRPRLWIVGYSRGAGAVLEVCHRLKKKNIQIYGLILYDAVDMSCQFDRGTIPSNVKYCVHFTRDQKSGASRESFQLGTIGRIAETGVKYFNLHTFHCTHGGAGGVFFKKDKVDPETGFINEGFVDQSTRVTRSQDYDTSQLIMSLTNVFIQTYRYTPKPNTLSKHPVAPRPRR